MISLDIIEKIKLSINIADYIREYIPALKRSGRNYSACCPFHQEKTPSFMVSPEKGIFHCFGCGAGGDVFRFIMKMDGLTFTEAVKKVGDQCGITVDDTARRGTSPEVSLRQKLESILESAKDFYRDCFKTHPEALHARTYIERRGINAEQSERFALGYAPRSGNAFRDYALKKGYAQNLLLQSGLVNVSRNSELRDHFWGRIMFPIVDTQGRIVAFGGRVLDDALPKYINSSETALFSKSKILYGLQQGLSMVRETRTVLLMEGYTDVMLSHQYGFSHAVAPLGTALTREHALLLKRYVETVVLIFDPDEAGKNAAVRAAELLYEAGLFVKAALLPDGLDPADLLRERGPEIFKQCVEQAKDWIEFFIDIAVGEKSGASLTPQNKATIASTVLPAIARIENAVYRQQMRQLLSKKIAVPEEVLIEEMQHLHQESERFPKRSYAPALPQTAKRDIRIQEELITVLITHPQLIKNILASDNNFTDIRCKTILEVMKNDYRMYGALEPTRIMSVITDEHAAWLSHILLEARQYKNPEHIFEQLIEDLNRNILRQKQLHLQQELKTTLEHNQTVDAQIAEEYKRLNKSLKGREYNG